MKDDTISRRSVIKEIDELLHTAKGESEHDLKMLRRVIKDMLPSAQPERDIPKKPISTTDRAWGIPLRQAVCPNYDVYLGMIHFISENGKTKVTYCETCGQAIDWEGWDYDE